MPLPPIGATAAAAPPTAVSLQKPCFVLRQARPEQAAGPAQLERAAGPGRALASLQGVERAQQRLDAVLAAARAGRTFTAQELLGLQAEAYRAVQTVELATKVVEQGAQSVKQALNAQV